MMRTSVCAFLIVLLAVSAQAGLNDPAVLNPGFEADILDAATKSNAITDWWNRTSYCWVSEETQRGDQDFSRGVCQSLGGRRSGRGDGQRVENSDNPGVGRRCHTHRDIRTD